MNVLSRSLARLKTAVQRADKAVCDETGELTEMKDRLLSLLGIAKRAGRLTAGFDAAVISMKNGESRLLLLSDELSDRSKSAAAAAAEQYGVEFIYSGCTMEETGHALGRKHTGIVSVNDNGFAVKIKTLCAQNSQEECI